ncbi:MAG: transporter permease, partial [Rhizobiaceae bacterium]|nr:transporter permease [Rhizobiaceae bacterium]
MTSLRVSWQAVLALLLMALAAAMPDMVTAGGRPDTASFLQSGRALILALPAAAAALSFIRMPHPIEALLLFIAAHLTAWLLISGIAGFEGTAQLSFFFVLAAAWLLAWRCVSILSG